MSNTQTSEELFKQAVERASKNLSIPAESLIARNEVVALLDKITQVTNAEEQNLAVEILTKGKKILKDVEAVRVDLKSPVTALGNAIQRLAAEFSSPLQAKLEEKLRLVSAFQTAEAIRVRKEEEARQAAIRAALAAEEENKRKLAEAQRVAAEQAAAAAAEEARKVAAAEEAKKLAEAAALAAGQPAPVVVAPAAQEDSEGASDIGALLAEQTVQAAAEVVQQSSAAVVAIINAQEPEKAKSKGLSSRMVWRYRITNQSEALTAHPELFKVEPKPSAINSAKSMDRNFECPGIEFWEEAAPTLRA